MTINPMLDMLLMLATGKVQNAAKVQTYTPGSIERACRNPEEAEGESRIERALRRPRFPKGSSPFFHDRDRNVRFIPPTLCLYCRDPACGTDHNGYIPDRLGPYGSRDIT